MKTVDTGADVVRLNEETYGKYWLTTFPVAKTVTSLFYHRNADSVVMMSPFTTMWELLTPFRVPNLLPSLAIYFLLHLGVKLGRFREWPAPMSLLANISLYFPVWIYGLGAKDQALKALLEVPPFQTLSQLLPLLRQGKAHLSFWHKFSAEFEVINRSHSGALRQIADTFTVNPPVFLSSGEPEPKGLIVKVMALTELDLELLEHLYPCTVEAKAFRQYFPTTYFAYIFRKGERLLVEQANSAIPALYGMEANYQRFHGKRPSVAGCAPAGRGEAYGPLTVQIMKDLGGLVTPLILATILVFLLELIWPRLRQRMAMSFF